MKPLAPKRFGRLRWTINPLTLVLTFGLVFSLVNYLGPGLIQDVLAESGVPDHLGMAAAEPCEPSAQPELNLSLAEDIECSLEDGGGGRDWLGESKEAFDYLNTVRAEHGRAELAWDEISYLLAVYRSKDMSVRGYFDHVTPEGECVKDYKNMFGFGSQYNVAENIGVLAHYDNGMPTKTSTPNDAVEGWLTSRGHRYNLLHQDHQRGAIGCYKAVCTFIGANNFPSGLGTADCITGEEALRYWADAPPKPDEI